MGNEWAEHVVANRSGIILRARSVGVSRRTPSFLVFADSSFVRSLYSTLLKSDQWLTKAASSSDGVRGAVGFRQIPGSNIYACVRFSFSVSQKVSDAFLCPFSIGQPTEDAIGFVLSKIKERTPTATALVWLNLREEPLVVSRAVYRLPLL